MVTARLDIRHRPKAFFSTQGRHKRPDIKLEIFRTDNKHKKAVWEVFRRYHYLNTDLHQGAEQYVAIWQGRLVAHTGIIQMPMKKGQKRVHRFVVLPDYQGIGIGTAFITEVGRLVTARGYELNLTTTTPSLVPALCKHPHWLLARYGRSQGKMQFDVYGKQYTHLRNTISNNRVTYSFWYTENGKQRR